MKYRQRGNKWLVFDGDRLVAIMPVFAGGDHDHSQTWQEIRGLLDEMAEAMRDAHRINGSLRVRDLNPAERDKRRNALRRELDDVLRSNRARLQRVVEAEIEEANRPATVTGAGIDWSQLSARRDGLVGRLQNAKGGSVGRVLEEELIDAPEQYRPALVRAGADVVTNRNNPQERREFAAVRARYLTEPEALHIGRRAAAEQLRSALTWFDQTLPREAARAMADNGEAHNPSRYLGLWADAWHQKSVAAGVAAVERVQAGANERMNPEPATTGSK